VEMNEVKVTTICRSCMTPTTKRMGAICGWPCSVLGLRGLLARVQSRKRVLLRRGVVMSAAVYWLCPGGVCEGAGVLREDRPCPNCRQERVPVRGGRVLTREALEAELAAEAPPRQVPAPEAFVRHLCTRLAEDGDLFWLCGPGTETARLLCAAVAELTGRPVEDVERELRQVTPRQARTLFARGESR
jgi:hypothetical protein